MLCYNVHTERESDLYYETSMFILKIPVIYVSINGCSVIDDDEDSSYGVCIENELSQEDIQQRKFYEAEYLYLIAESIGESDGFNGYIYFIGKDIWTSVGDTMMGAFQDTIWLTSDATERIEEHLENFEEIKKVLQYIRYIYQGDGFKVYRKDR